MDDFNAFNSGEIHAGDDEYTVQLKRVQRALGYGAAPDGSGGTYVAGGSTNTTQRAPVTVASSAGGTNIVAASTKARDVSLRNTGATAVELFYGTTAGAAGTGFFSLAAGVYWESPAATNAPISGLSASGTNNVVAVEYL